MPGCARRCSIGSPIRPTLSKQVRSRTVFAGPCGRNAKSDPWRPPFHSASASPYGLRSSRTELYPLNLQRPKVGQIKPPKWAKPTCQKHKDQYYIKTSEYLRDYAFRLRPNDDKKPMRVHYFRLADAAEGEHDNVKAAEGKDRVFVLSAAGESGHDFIA